MRRGDGEERGDEGGEGGGDGSFSLLSPPTDDPVPLPGNESSEHDSANLSSESQHPMDQAPAERLRDARVENNRILIARNGMFTTPARYPSASSSSGENAGGRAHRSTCTPVLGP